jgi:Transcriptional regulatory protein, C terminal
MDNFAPMRPFILFGSSVMIIGMLIAAVAFIGKKSEIPEKHVEVVLRTIGHQLLLSAKDSTSRVLPVKQLDENSYQVSFQHNVGFKSDTLINIVQRTFQKSALAKDYIVNLKNCDQKETVLAFEMNGKTGDLTPCRGRTLELGCYIIEIDLLTARSFNFRWLWLLIIPLIFAGYYIKDKYQKKEVKESISDSSDYIQVGNFQLFIAKNVLKNEHRNITLSENETKALEIFAQHINQVVEREKLMKDIWEDKGLVVISRNVDVLVSKLRKKLADDHSIKIVNVPGRGYKFIIG